MSSASFIKLAIATLGVMVLAVFAFTYFNSPDRTAPESGASVAERIDVADASSHKETEPVEKVARSTISTPPSADVVPEEGATAGSTDVMPPSATAKTTTAPPPSPSPSAGTKRAENRIARQPEQSSGTATGGNRSASGQVSPAGSAPAPSKASAVTPQQRGQSGTTFTAFPAQAQTGTVGPSAAGSSEDLRAAAGNDTEPADASGESQPSSSNSATRKPFDDATDEPETTSSSTVRMVPSASELAVGERLSITVEIAAGNDVGHVPFHVRFNPAVLRFEAGEQGPYLGSDGIQTAFFASATSSADTVVVGLSRYGAVPGIQGDGMLCTLHFTTIGPGDAGLTFARSHVRDSQNRIVPAGFQAAGVVVR